MNCVLRINIVVVVYYQLLFKSYCMNIYGSQIWPYSKNCLSKYYISCRKAIWRLWKIPYRTHNKFIHIVNNWMPINITLEKRCIKYLWNMINSNCKLYHNIVNLSLNNVNTTIGENLYKYMIQEYDWYESINIIYKKNDSYMLSHFNAKVQCDAAVIRELCELRDSCSDLL